MGGQNTSFSYESSVVNMVRWREENRLDLSRHARGIALKCRLSGREVNLRGFHVTVAVDKIQCDRDPAFEELMDLPSVYPVLARALREGRGREAGEPRLLSGPVCQHLPGGTDR